MATVVQTRYCQPLETYREYHFRLIHNNYFFYQYWNRDKRRIVNETTHSSRADEIIKKNTH